MTTDNRTNEPTPEQVDVAADAAGRVLYPHWDEWEEHDDMAKAHGELMRVATRAALAAAQGAAPQADGAHQHEWDAETTPPRMTCECAAPVQPASTVDEFRFTDAQWREYQSIPMQGYSHRHHLEHVFNEWLKGQGR